MRLRNYLREKTISNGRDIHQILSKVQVDIT